MVPSCKGSITIKGVGQVFVNDSVYVAAPYDSRAGEPYMIGRVQEILSNDKMRIAFYLRPRDIGSRIAQHGRRILASMHADVVPVTNIRGKCLVMHRDHLPGGDQEAYRRRPDAFYYNQLYDRYLHRYFDVVPTERVRNASEQVLACLNQRFEFIACEVSVANDLCNLAHPCSVCQKFTTSAEAVTCDDCNRAFHLQCLNPPLAYKPGRGFGWSCAPCSQKRAEELEDCAKRGVSPPPSATTDLRPTGRSQKAKGKLKAVSLASSSDPDEPTANLEAFTRSIKMFHGWPFRYYGAHTDPLTVTDPHDSIYPRASSVRYIADCLLGLPAHHASQRIGPKHQTVLTDAPQGAVPLASSSKFKDPVIDRGGDTVEIISRLTARLDEEEEAELAVYMDKIKELDLYKLAGVDLLDKAIQYWTSDSETAFEKAAALEQEDLDIPFWTESEKSKVDHGLEQWQDDLEEIAIKLPKKTLAELVNFVYLRRPQVSNMQDARQEDDKYASGGPHLAVQRPDEAEADIEEGADLDDRSRAGTPPPRGKHGPCAVCEGKESPAWYRCPSGVGWVFTKKEKVLCQDCSIQWRHYGNDAVIVEDPRAKPTKASVTGTKRTKAKLDAENGRDSSAAPSRARTPSPPPPPPPPPKIIIPPKPCVLCKRMEPRITLAQCQKCTLSAHSACYGILDDVDLDEWRCELCAAEAAEQLSIEPRWSTSKSDPTVRLHQPQDCREYRCIACPEMVLPESATGSTDKTVKEIMSALDVLKRTEQNQLIHLLCAVWHLETLITDTALYGPVEGSSSIPPYRWAKTCSICKLKDVGACVDCADCAQSFHVSCAWSAGYKFGFEFEPIPPPKKKKDKVLIEPVYFKDASGLMRSKIWCKSHKADSSRRIFDLGEKDPATQMTCLQTFVDTSKNAYQPETTATLRRARRLDDLTRPALLGPINTAPPQPPGKRGPAKGAKGGKATKGKAPAKAKAKGKTKAKGKAKAQTTKKGKPLGRPKKTVEEAELSPEFYAEQEPEMSGYYEDQALVEGPGETSGVDEGDDYTETHINGSMADSGWPIFDEYAEPATNLSEDNAVDEEPEHEPEAEAEELTGKRKRKLPARYLDEDLSITASTPSPKKSTPRQKRTKITHPSAPENAPKHQESERMATDFHAFAAENGFPSVLPQEDSYVYPGSIDYQQIPGLAIHENLSYYQSQVAPATYNDHYQLSEQNAPHHSQYPLQYPIPSSSSYANQFE